MKDGPENSTPRLKTLLETVRLLNSTLELKELTEIILDVVRAEVAVDRVSVFVLEPGKKTLRPLVTQEVEGGEISFPIGVGIAGIVAATGEILDIPDAYADTRFNRQFDRKFGFYTNDLFALPVCNRIGEIVGVLELLNRLRPITPSDREFLSGISVYIGLALENAWLHAQFAQQSGPVIEESPSQGPLDPLLFAMGFLELIPEQGDLPASVWSHVESMRSGLAATAEAASKFREFLDGQRDGLSRIDLGSELRSLGELQTDGWERNNIKATLIVENTPPVYAYAYELRLVLAFLIRRAEAAVIQPHSDRKLLIHSWSGGKSVLVSIQYSESAGELGELGSSYGFAVANRILHQCGGQIRFESTPERGTTILLDLPVVHESITE